MRPSRITKAGPASVVVVASMACAALTAASGTTVAAAAHAAARVMWRIKTASQQTCQRPRDEGGARVEELPKSQGEGGCPRLWKEIRALRDLSAGIGGLKSRKGPE